MSLRWKKIADETKKLNFGGPLAFVSTMNVEDMCSDSEEGNSEEGLLMNSDDEVVAYYSSNSVKVLQEAFIW